MSSTLRIRHILKNLVVSRLFSSWTRSYIVSSVVKRCRRDRGVLEVIHCFRHAFFRPSRTLFLSVTAAYKAKDEEPQTAGCDKNISDADIQTLVTELETVEELSRRTLYCQGCAKRVILDKKHSGVVYCACKDATPPESSHEGWVPYMEAEDVVIWRKEYKPGGLYAYKVYGRYQNVRARDFAAVQVDGAYRRAWDDAVAALAVVERQANGTPGQLVLHWEVLWPRLFANRDYVYIRRHKEFDVKTKCLRHTDGIFNRDEPCGQQTESIHERPNVHSNAKRKSMEMEKNKRAMETLIDNKLYVIVSRSCVHPQVPATRNAIRVTEYWSHMVIKTVDGPDKPGAEFVLTYYDEPAVGGMPTAVASFAAARGAPVFLAKMRQAAMDYDGWRKKNHQEAPDFTPFGPEKVSYEDRKAVAPISELDMESSTRGPELDDGYRAELRRDQSTQTEGGDDPAATGGDQEQQTFDEGATKISKADISKQETNDTELLLSLIGNKNPHPAADTLQTPKNSKEIPEIPEALAIKPEGVGEATVPERIAKVPEQTVQSRGNGDTLEGDSDKKSDDEAKNSGNPFGPEFGIRPWLKRKRINLKVALL